MGSLGHIERLNKFLRTSFFVRQNSSVSGLCILFCWWFWAERYLIQIVSMLHKSLLMTGLCITPLCNIWCPDWTLTQRGVCTTLCASAEFFRIISMKASCKFTTKKQNFLICGTLINYHLYNIYVKIFVLYIFVHLYIMFLYIYICVESRSCTGIIRVERKFNYLMKMRCTRTKLCSKKALKLE